MVSTVMEPMAVTVAVAAMTTALLATVDGRVGQAGPSPRKGHSAICLQGGYLDASHRLLRCPETCSVASIALAPQC